MPRSGVNGEFTWAPGNGSVNPNTTIASPRENSIQADIAQTFNTPQPLAYGGTNASTPIGAIDNLVTKGTDIATSSSVNLDGATGIFVDLTGTTTVTSVTLTEGRQRMTRAAGAFQITVSATLIGNNQGQNVAVNTGDLIVWEGYAGGIVRFWIIPSLTQLGAWSVIGSERVVVSGSPVPAIVWTDLSAWKHLRWSGTARPVVNDASLIAQVSVDNGASWISSGYTTQYIRSLGSTLNANELTGNSSFNLHLFGSGNGAGMFTKFDGSLSNFNKPSPCTLLGEAYGISASQSVSTYGGRESGAVARNALRILFSTGNIAEAGIVLEGIKG